jgi:4,5-dihydroxyphthalate decarboxylase
MALTRAHAQRQSCYKVATILTLTRALIGRDKTRAARLGDPVAASLSLTLACGDYEIVRPLKEGLVRADGIDLEFHTDMDSHTRHRRMIRERAFDVCELSLSSYLMAKDRDQALAAIPVFLHRRFRHGFVFVNVDKGIRHAADLIGRRVGTNSFQATANVWMRGILEHEHQLPHKKVRWLVEQDEAVAFTPASNLDWARTPPGRTLASLLTVGELDAVMHTDVIAPIREHDLQVKRLFPNYKDLEIDYYRRTGIFPIMHTTAIKREIVDRHPWVAVSLQRAFEEAKERAYERLQNPRIVPLAWYQSALEEQQVLLGKDPWAYGLNQSNRHNLQALISYSHEQGLIGNRFTVDELFVDTVT